MKDELIALLNEPLDPAHVSKRQGMGSMTLSYLTGEHVTRTANRIFGIGGWSTRVTQYPTEVAPGIIQATVMVTIHAEDDLEGFRTNVCHYEDTGVGTYNPAKANGQEIEKAIKESVTDATKRAFVSLGDQFGLALYDKNNPIHSQVSNFTPGTPEGVKPVQARPTVLPEPNDGDKFKCEDCGREIKATSKRSAAENASFGYAQSGKIRCFNCRTGS